MKRSFMNTVAVSALLAISSGTPLLTSEAVAEVMNEESFAIEQITVTARRREERMQDIPIAVSAFSGEDLLERTMSSTADLDKFVPNLVSSTGAQGGSSTQYTIRGAGQQDWIATFDPAVGVYLDGVYLGRITGAALDLVQVERVEVMRGPQGTLFGRNTIGGAINVVTRRPVNEFGGQASLTIGRFDRADARLSLDLPVVEDELSASFGFLRRNRDGWMRSLANDRLLGEQDRLAARGAILWTPTDTFELSINGDWARERGTEDPVNLIAADAAFGGRPEFVVSNRRVTQAGFAPGNEMDAWGVSADAKLELDAITVRSITSYRSLESVTGVDFDGGPLVEIDQLVTTDQYQFSQELQISGNFLEDRLSWLGGLYYYKEDADQISDLAIFTIAASQGNFMKNRSIAGFLHVDFAITEKLALSSGVRANFEKKRHFFDHKLILPIEIPITNPVFEAPLFPPQELSETWSPITWRHTLEYTVKEGALVYASISRGFRAGGFNGRPVGIGELLSYDPETLLSYEAGLKSDWLDGRLRLNAAAFYNDYKDIQATFLAPGAGGTPIVFTENAAKAEMYGLEVETIFQPLEGLRLNASIGYLENKYKDLQPGVSLDPTDKLVMAPKWTISTGIEYEVPLANAGSLTLRADHSYKSKFFYFPQNNPLDLQEGYHLVNLRGTYRPTDANWRVSAYGINVFNKDYALFLEDVRTSFGPALRWPAPPVEWGFELAVNF